ncbi:hypothetical protein [Spongiactinospora sp. TRM90649]|uniref:hypothetical protein n=1 Tax=Spongiactinospora sp. TRM90649 TaxID=3031114 RepID=UPI0023F6F5DA|nr:hypothetical protein [Spongiactinospora sp. TRM90649]MDF5751099.1 hypothetical protein [Spongiactinospora sp. TRM90649]
MTRDPDEGEQAMLAALDTLPGGEGWARVARITGLKKGYAYGPTLRSAHREGDLIVTGDGEPWTHS